MSTAVSTQKQQSLMATMAARFNVPEDEMLSTLKATAFKGQVSDAQMTALLIVANQYGLNPWTKEIYAYPDNNNGIVPVVGIDGWARIINENPNFDGVEFEYGPQENNHHVWIDCIMYRKDRSRPTRIREFFSEVNRNKGPWQSHPNRMHRHKSLIQCGRVGFGFVGIYDEDEAERIIEVQGTSTVVPQAQPARPAIEQYPKEAFDKNFQKWESAIKEGKKSPSDVIAAIESKAMLTEEMKTKINNVTCEAI